MCVCVCVCVYVCVCVSNRFAQFNKDKEGNIKTIQDLEEVCMPSCCLHNLFICFIFYVLFTFTEQ